MKTRIEKIAKASRLVVAISLLTALALPGAVLASGNDTVPLTIQPSDPGASYSVSVDVYGQVTNCQVPCTVNVPPGMVRVSVAGDAQYEQTILVPSGTAVATINQESSALSTTSTILSTVSLLLTASGATYSVITDDYMTPLYYVYGPAVALAIGGLVTILASGDDEIDVSRSDPSLAKLDDSDESGFSFVSASVTPLPEGGGSFGLAFSF